MMTLKRGKPISNAEFRRLWLDMSITTAQIGEQLGISQQAGCARASTRGLPKRRKGPAPTVSEDEVFRAMWISGVSNLEMAKRLGISERTVRNHVSRLGLDRRCGGTNHGITAEEFAQAQMIARMRDDAALVKAQWKLAEMVDAPATSGRWAA